MHVKTFTKLQEFIDIHNWREHLELLSQMKGQLKYGYSVFDLALILPLAPRPVIPIYSGNLSCNQIIRTYQTELLVPWHSSYIL